MQDVEKVESMRAKEIQDHFDRVEELNIELRQIEYQKLTFRKEMEKTEKELR